MNWVRLRLQTLALKCRVMVGSVESVETVSGIYSPVDGEVLKKNENVVESPEQLTNLHLKMGG